MLVLVENFLLNNVLKLIIKAWYVNLNISGCKLQKKYFAHLANCLLIHVNVIILNLELNLNLLPWLVGCS